MSLIKNKNRLYVMLILLILLPLCLVACDKYEDLSDNQPYAEAIGKKFILQQDFYMYKYNDTNEINIGPLENISFHSRNLPKVVNKKYIGVKNDFIQLVGIAKFGDVIKIIKASKKVTFENEVFLYYVQLTNNQKIIFNNINVFMLMNMKNNPPDNKTWSDPPIFDAKYALPLPSDGVWWK